MAATASTLHVVGPTLRPLRSAAATRSRQRVTLQVSAH